MWKQIYSQVLEKKIKAEKLLIGWAFILLMVCVTLFFSTSEELIMTASWLCFGVTLSIIGAITILFSQHVVDEKGRIVARTVKDIRILLCTTDHSVEYHELKKGEYVFIVNQDYPVQGFVCIGTIDGDHRGYATVNYFTY